jgi:DNA-binding transcriptional MocR family regulator
MADEVISFARGAPSADILPAEAVRKAAERALADDWERALSYGKGAGHPGLREWIAQAHDLEPEQVMVTNGSLEGGAMLFDHLLGAGDSVIVEQPSYDRTLLLLSRIGVRLVGVALEANGVDIEALEVALGEGDTPRLVHVIPNFHNPAGCTLSDDKRRRLVELAAEHGFTLFEDDPYREVGFAGEPSPTMLSLDRADRVIYASSFSKTVSPGVRVGYLAGPIEAIAALAKRANEIYISPNMLAESVVWELCRSGGLAENTEFVKRALRERRDALTEALRGELPEAEFVVPEGGYFLWLSLRDDVDTGALLSAATEEGVAFIPGADFMLQGGQSSLRLSFAGVPPGHIPEGVARLARALERTRAASPA